MVCIVDCYNLIEIQGMELVVEKMGQLIQVHHPNHSTSLAWVDWMDWDSCNRIEIGPLFLKKRVVFINVWLHFYIHYILKNSFLHLQKPIWLQQEKLKIWLIFNILTEFFKKMCLLNNLFISIWIWHYTWFF